MALSLDHAVLVVRDLAAASADCRALGFTVTPGGVHANRATHNALVLFRDGTYLELLAATGEAPLPGLVDFSVMLAAGEGLAGFALRSTALERDSDVFRARGLAVSAPIPGERLRPDGKRLRWRLALMHGGAAAHAFAPFLIEDVTPRIWRVPDDPALTTHASGAAGLHAVEVAPRADGLWALLGDAVMPRAGTPGMMGGLHIAGVDTPRVFKGLTLSPLR